jgi:hypothetical protein
MTMMNHMLNTNNLQLRSRKPIKELLSALYGRGQVCQQSNGSSVPEKAVLRVGEHNNIN